MKKITILFTAFVAIFINSVKAQNDRKDDISDISFYSIIPFDTSQTARPFLWFWHDGGADGAYYETRLNLDALNTGALVMGRTFGNQRFFITPKMGALLAFDKFGFDGVTMEFNMGGELGFDGGGYLIGFTMSQFAFAVDENPNFAYNYTRVGYGKDWFQIYFSFQIFQQRTKYPESWIDMGPQMKFSIGNFYIKPWLTFDPNHGGQEKAIVGIGYTFK